MVLRRVTLVGLSKSHAMATFVGYDTPVRCGTGSHTTFMDATRGGEVIDGPGQWLLECHWVSGGAHVARSKMVA
ncbi:hypothetical protein FXW78_30115 [Rhodococcus opacus]|nr:hypothetical protein [Rhodococcus opacus]RZL80254.1 MAG: hypothetical protein EOP32_17400 [Rhodococcus sp. (in: high G+C Gram-positive bacteria)]